MTQRKRTCAGRCHRLVGTVAVAVAYVGRAHMYPSVDEVHRPGEEVFTIAIPTMIAMKPTDRDAPSPSLPPDTTTKTNFITHILHGGYSSLLHSTRACAQFAGTGPTYPPANSQSVTNGDHTNHTAHQKSRWASASQSIQHAEFSQHVHSAD